MIRNNNFEKNIQKDLSEKKELINKAATDTKQKSRKFIDEFKKFALKGDVINLAVGVIVGAAFKSIVDSLVADVISPVIGLFADVDFKDWVWVIKTADDGTKVAIKYGSFITAIINFFIMALVIFLMIKLFSRVAQFGKTKPEEEKKVKTCPFCFSEINIKATRCPFCTSEQSTSQESETE